MSTICIYHVNCADGFGAAWAVRKRYQADGQPITFHAAQYGDAEPHVEGETVIIVDFSYPHEVLSRLSGEARGVLVLDHHKTAAEDLQDIPGPATYRGWGPSEGLLSAQFDMDRSGAGIAWDFFHPGVPRPDFIDRIEDRDLWRFDFDDSRQLHAAVRSYPFDFDLWDEFERPARFNLLLQEGEAILRRQAQDMESIMKGVRPLHMAGYDIRAVNAPPFYASEIGNKLAERKAFAAVYWDQRDKRVFSLRSWDDGVGIDVSEIAKQYGGGGHKNAAGFTVPIVDSLRFETSYA